MTTPSSFPCREKGCTAVVRYERHVTQGALLRRNDPAPQAIVIYLACAEGHVHRYEVPPAGESKGD